VVGGSDAIPCGALAHLHREPSPQSARIPGDIRAARTQVFGAHSAQRSLAADIYGLCCAIIPTCFALQNGEFNPVLRLQNITLSLLAVPS